MVHDDDPVARATRVELDHLRAERTRVHERVDRVVLRESLPRTMVGKLDRKALRLGLAAPCARTHPVVDEVFGRAVRVAAAGDGGEFYGVRQDADSIAKAIALYYDGTPASELSPRAIGGMCCCF